MLKHSTNDTKKLIDRLASVEFAFEGARFLAPAIPGGKIRVKLGGVVCRIKIAPDDFIGFGLFEAISMTEAVLVREASLAEKQRYLQLFPAVCLIACEPVRATDSSNAAMTWQAIAAQKSDSRFRFDGPVLVQLAQEIQPCDVLDCRFDGTSFWFEDINRRWSARHGQLLREALEDSVDPSELTIPNLHGSHRAAYTMLLEKRLTHQRQLTSGDNSLFVEDRGRVSDDPLRCALQTELSRAGGQLTGFVERGDSIQVTFQVGNSRFSSAVRKDNFSVLSSGICLSGQDGQFDLNSLVGVFREGMAKGEIYRE